MDGKITFRLLIIFALITLARTEFSLAQCATPSCSGADLSCSGDMQYSGCCDSLACRDHFFGDWLGLRSGLAENGVIVDLPYTQFYQGVADGGVEQASAYGGKLDYFLTFQGAKLGFNEGLQVLMHAETRYGEDVNNEAGVLAFPNAAMFYPLPNQNETAITQLLVMQALSERWAINIGKYNGLDLFNMLYPNTGRGIDGFMNLSLLIPPTLFRTTGLSVNGAGIMQLEGQQIQSAFMVYDTNSTSTTVAPDLFDNGAVMLGYHRFFTECGGLPGSHGFLGNYSTGTYASTDPLNWTVIPGQGIAAGQETGSWTLAYFLDQTLWMDCCNPNRNVKLFSAWSLADGNPNPYSWTGNVQLQAQGLIHGREADTMGVGYFYDGLSDEFKTLVNAVPGIDVQDVHGVELYYNAAIRKWLNITADLQVVENQNVGDDTAIILGLRAKIDL